MHLHKIFKERTGPPKPSQIGLFYQLTLIEDLGVAKSDQSWDPRDGDNAVSKYK